MALRQAAGSEGASLGEQALWERAGRRQREPGRRSDHEGGREGGEQLRLAREARVRGASQNGRIAIIYGLVVGFFPLGSLAGLVGVPLFGHEVPIGRNSIALKNF